MKRLEQIIEELLLERGWEIDPKERANKVGELFDLIHPETGKKFTLRGATDEQMMREETYPVHGRPVTQDEWAKAGEQALPWHHDAKVHTMERARAAGVACFQKRRVGEVTSLLHEHARIGEEPCGCGRCRIFVR